MNIPFLSVGRTVVRRSLLRPDARKRVPRRSQRRLKSTSADTTKASKAESTSTTAPSAEGKGVRSENDGQLDIPNVFWYHRLGPVTELAGWYDRTQKARPYTVQLYSSLLVYLVGDLGAQNFEGGSYDPWRTIRHLIVGGLASAPGYRWFMFLGNQFNYASKFLSVGAKVVVQQVVFAPLFNTYFFTMQALLAGQGFAGIRERFAVAIPQSVINSAKFWPAVTAVNFWLIPAQYRFLFAGGFAAGWQSYLSWLNSRESRRMKSQPDKRVPAYDPKTAANSNT